MIKYDQLYNFISPVTGKLRLPYKYLFIGDNNDFSSYAKTINVDNLPDLTPSYLWTGDTNNRPVEILNLPTINLPILGAAKITLPTLPTVPIPNPMFNPLSLDWFFSTPWLLETFTGDPSTLNPYDTKTIVSNNLAATQINIGKIFKRIDSTGFIVKSKTITYNWDNPLVNTLPQTVKDIIGLDNTYTFTNAQALDQLQGKSLLMVDNTLADKGVIQSATLSNGRFWLGDNVNGIDNVPNEVQYLPLYNLTNLTSGKVWQGDGNNRPIEADIAPLDATYILQTPHNLLTNAQALSEVQSAVTTGQSILKVNHLPLTNSYKLAYAQGGVNVTTDDYITPTNLSAALESVMGYATSAAWDSFVLGAVVSGITALFGATISSAYGEYLFNNKYKPLQSEFTYQGTDDMSLWGQGNIWVDVKQKLGGPNNANYRPGIRLTSWDSSFLFSDDSPPLSIGIFGYKKNDGWFSSNNLNRQRGFVWQADMENDTNHENYRFPKKFSLRSVGHDFIYTLFGGSETTAGWHEANHNGSTITTVEKDEELMSYDKYEQKFTFEKTITINQYTIYQSHINIPSEDGSVFLHKVIID